MVIPWSSSSSEDEGDKPDEENEKVKVRPFNRALVEVEEKEYDFDKEEKKESDEEEKEEEKGIETPVKRRSIKRKVTKNVVQLSSDEEEEEKTVPQKEHEWNEEDDKKLKECFEQYKEMIDPWSMVVYDSYFLENHISKEIVMKHAVDLGLHSPIVSDDEEEGITTLSKRRRISVDDSDLCVC